VKNRKTKKYQANMLRNNSKESGEIHVDGLNPEEEKGRAAVGRIYRKGRF